METKPCILHIISSLTRGGSERQCATIYKYNDKDRHCIKICYFHEALNNYVREYKISPRDIVKIKSKNKLMRFFEVYNILSKIKPDLIFAWGPMETIVCLPYSIIKKISLINGSIRHGARLKKLGHFMRMLLLHISPNIVANSNAGLIANKLKRGYVLYNGIDKKFERILNTGEKIEKRKKMIGQIDDRLILISVANFVPAKDFFSVIEALRSLKNAGYKFYYFILGDGPLKNSIQKFIFQKKLQNDVKIIGQVNNIQDYLSISDVFIHSSRGEGCSNAILEAMFQGLPIIASNVGGTKEITSSKNAFLFRYKDVQNLMENLKIVFEKPVLRENAGHSSHKIALERFNVNKMMERYYEIIETIMNKP